jgi:hypothetical protein
MSSRLFRSVQIWFLASATGRGWTLTWSRVCPPISFPSLKMAWTCATVSARRACSLRGGGTQTIQLWASSARARTTHLALDPGSCQGGYRHAATHEAAWLATASAVRLWLQAAMPSLVKMRGEVHFDYARVENQRRAMGSLRRPSAARRCRRGPPNRRPRRQPRPARLRRGRHRPGIRRRPKAHHRRCGCLRGTQRWRPQPAGAASPHRTRAMAALPGPGLLVGPVDDVVQDRGHRQPDEQRDARPAQCLRRRTHKTCQP